MISGERTVLRPPDAKDLEALGELRNDVAFQRSLMALPRPNSADRVQAWVKARTEDPHGLFFVVADKRTDGCVGFAQLLKMDAVHGTGELGIGIAPAAQGKGYGGEALALLERYGAATFGVRKIVLSVLAENEAARRVYERAGYALVGVHRAHFFSGGRYLDVVLMEKLLTELLAQRSA